MNLKTAPIVSLLLLGGCGLTVPSMQEIGQDASKVVPDKVALVGEIRCEVAKGIYQAVNDPNFGSGAANAGKPVDWLLKWAVKADLQITVDDKGTFGPGVTFTSPFGTPAQSFSLGLGFQASADGQRKEEIAFTYAAQDLYDEVKQNVAAGNYKAAEPCGADGLFIHGDLKIGEFISQNIFLARPQDLIPNSPNPFNAFNDQIQFIIVYSGNVTPSWKLVRFSVNPSSPFASIMKTRTQYLTLTFGPPQTPPSPAGSPTPVQAPALRLNDSAEAVHNASLIGQAVLGAIRSGVTP